jgi:hypothetical protein
MNIIQRDPSKRIKDPNDRELKGESKFEASKTSTFGAKISLKNRYFMILNYATSQSRLVTVKFTLSRF